jgi:hypothetical protein
MDSDVEIGEEWEPVDQQQLLAEDAAQEDPAAAADAEDADAGFLLYLNGARLPDCAVFVVTHS